MRKIILISCVSKKLSHKASARHLYISPLFKKNLAYAQRLNPDAIFVLSAKFGLVDLDQEIEPYDLTLNTMSADQIKVWAVRVLTQLSERADLSQDHFVFLAIESEPPYVCEPYRIDAAAEERGYQLRDRAMQKQAQCIADGTWPGYSDGTTISSLTLPGWAFYD